MTKREHERQEAIDHLRTIIKPGDTVYTVLRHVSRSGMTRGIDVYILQTEAGYGSSDDMKAVPVWITAFVGKAIDSPQPMDYWRKSLGLKVGGCGMDMGFHVVNSLSYALYGKGYQCLGKGQCPSNYHVNHRDRVRCDGIGTGDDWKPCFQSSELRHKVDLGDGLEVDGRHMFVIHEGDNETVCPRCKGEGYTDNPDGPEKFDLEHTDSYALRHKWL